MKITYKADYALKAVLDLAVHYGQGVVTIQDMAGRIDASAKFLEQILFQLRKARVIKSKRGKVGGYFLARPPQEITVGDIVRVIEGPVEPIACIRKEYTECADMHSCVFKRIWEDVADATTRVVDGVNFAELAAQVTARAHECTYII
jgi:Rrf2 family transcriptional regulator, cysteine metabolism repressor